MLEQTILRGETPVALDLTEEEEAERASELHQRETLLLNMGVVNQVRQLLQSANHLTELINHSREQFSFPSHCRHHHKYVSKKQGWLTPPPPVCPVITPNNAVIIY